MSQQHPSAGSSAEYPTDSRADSPPSSAAPGGAAGPGAGGSRPEPGIDSDSSSLGEIVSEISSDFSTLMRQELDLMKAELKEEASKAAAGVGMLGGAGFAGYFLLLFASVALMAALDAVMPLGWAALVVAALWGIVGTVLAARGRARLTAVNPKPEQTLNTLKEDAQWAKHPTK